MTVGYLSGGSDIGVKMFAADGSPFAGGSGVVVSLKPAGFLCDDGAECRYIRMEGDPLDNLIDKASEFLSGIRGDA